MAERPTKPLSDKEMREKKLAEALRVNLRRRKAPPAAAGKKSGEERD